MKRLFSLLLAFIIILSLCACEGNWESVNLKDPIGIPENGVIKINVIKQVKQENAIAVFTGKSGDYKYEWTIFGSDVSEPKEINLGVQLSKTNDGYIKVVLNQTEAFGFSALLSIYLNEKWDAQGATAYANDKAIASASVTGSKTTILNLTLDGAVNDFTIRPDALPEDENDTPTTEITTPNQTPSTPSGGQDDYLSKPQQNGGKDKYNTDPVPEGKPKPVEPEDQEVDKGKTYTCTFSIECSTILNNLSMLDPDKLEMVPSGGVILAKTTVTFYEGESVFDVLQRVCTENKIHMEASWTPMYNSAYIEGIHNLYEFDCGALSGWMYKVNGWYPNYGCSRYQLQDGDVVEWRFTCDLGNDIGGGYAVGG
jgi:hypothetical protein